MVVLLATGAVPSAVAGLLAAGAIVLLGVLTIDQAYRGISWTTVILVGGMMSLSTAMVTSGAAEQLADGLVDIVGDLGPHALVLGVVLVTFTLGQLISNMATALIVIPIAVSAAAEMDVSAKPVLMAVTVAAAASFLTPVATPANLMVMGPGGYRFGDYWKLGLPLLVLFGVVAVVPRPRLLVVLMDDWPELVDEPFVSTGTLPPEGRVEELVDHAHRRFRPDKEGALSDVYPALLEVDPDLFGICVTAVDGRRYGVGDAEVPFTIMSVSKPFVFALVCEARGVDEARRAVGVNATGLPFNSVDALERSDDARTNPMVNPGALATTSLAPGRDAEARWAFVLDGLARFAGRGLSLDEEVLASAIGDEPAEPAARGEARGARAPCDRRGRDRRSLHPPVLACGDRGRPGGDGRDARGRRRQPAHPRGGRLAGGLPGDARGDDDRRPLRDVG